MRLPISNVSFFLEHFAFPAHQNFITTPSLTPLRSRKNAAHPSNCGFWVSILEIPKNHSLRLTVTHTRGLRFVFLQPFLQRLRGPCCQSATKKILIIRPNPAVHSQRQSHARPVVWVSRDSPFRFILERCVGGLWHDLQVGSHGVQASFEQGLGFGFEQVFVDGQVLDSFAVFVLCFIPGVFWDQRFKLWIAEAFAAYFAQQFSHEHAGINDELHR